MGYFDRVTHGDVLSRVTNDVDTLGQSLNQSLSQVVVSLSTAVGVAVMMLSISWQMTLAALLILPLSGILMGWWSERARNTSWGSSATWASSTGRSRRCTPGTWW